MKTKSVKSTSRRGGDGGGSVVPKPPPVPAALRSQLRADPEVLEGMAEYRRRDESEVVIPEASITTELVSSGSTSQLGPRRSYTLHWLVPDPGNNRGALLSIDRFTLRIVNEGLFDVNLVVQQPHGHEAAPSSIAAWVLLANRTVKSGARVEFSIRPVDNNLVVPLRTDIRGADCVTFAAFSAVRQGLSPAGEAVPASEVGLRVKLEAHYTASGNALQGGDFFAMRTVSDDHMMFVVDQKPPTPICVQDVGRGVESLRVGKSEGYLVPVFMAGLNVLSQHDWVGLSSSHVYRLPLPVFGTNKKKSGVKAGAYLRWLPVNSGDYVHSAGWFIVSTYGSIEPIYAGNGDAYGMSIDENVAFSADCLLTPISAATFKPLKVTSSKLPVPAMRSIHSHLLRLNSTVDWRDDLLSAISFIVGIIKVAAAVAGAVGVLNVAQELEPREQHSVCSDFTELDLAKV